MESNPRLDRLRQQAGDLAENMGTQWADYVAAVINQWTDGEEQGLLTEAPNCSKCCVVITCRRFGTTRKKTVGLRPSKT